MSHYTPSVRNMGPTRETQILGAIALDVPPPRNATPARTKSCLNEKQFQSTGMSKTFLYIVFIPMRFRSDGNYYAITICPFWMLYHKKKTYGRSKRMDQYHGPINNW